MAFIFMLFGCTFGDDISEKDMFLFCLRAVF